MYDAIGRQQDLAEALRPDDREAEARYDYEILHRQTCPMDRMILIPVELKAEDGTRKRHDMHLPGCKECYKKYWRIEAPSSQLEQAEVIDLHPNRAA